MKRTGMWRVLSLILLLGLVFVFLPSCRLVSSSNPALIGETAAVQRGDISTYVTASGNLAFSRYDDLNFHMTGTVAEVNVEEGDNVTQGQVLVRLDTTDLEAALDRAELAVDTGELAVRSAEIDLKQAEGNINTARIDLEQKTDDFRKIAYPYTYSTFVYDVPAAIAAIHEAQLQLQLAKPALETGSGSEKYGDALDKFRRAQDNLVDAQQRLTRGQGTDVFIREGGGYAAVKDFWTLRTTQLAMEKAQATLDSTKIAFNKAAVALDKAKTEWEKAKKDRDKAKADLQKALIVAPYNAVVTKVNTAGGNEIKIGELAVSIAEPDKFEAYVLVNEVDIPWVKVDGKTSLQVDAMPGIGLPAIVRQIAPTATVQQGVVNYKVTIAVTSLEGTGPLRLEPGRGSKSSDAIRALGGSRSMAGQLRQGLSVTTNILKEEKKGVLLVLSRAIKRQGSDVFVQVVKSGTTEQRAVKIGLSDWQNTEVSEGLAEGEKVALQAKPTATTPPPGGTSRPLIPQPRGVLR